MLMQTVMDLVAVIPAAFSERFKLKSDLQLDVINALLLFGILPPAIQRLRQSAPADIDDGADKCA